MNMDYNKQEDILRFKMIRKGKLWKNQRKISIIIILFSLYILSYELFLPKRDFFYLNIITQNMAKYPLSYSLLSIFLFYGVSILTRPRYFFIDKSKGVIFYSLPIIGSKFYYFVEVCSIQFEIDMSEVLLKLKNKKLSRVYLKLHRGKTILITEDYNEKEIRKIADMLSEIFEVEVEQLHRVGRNRGGEIRLGDYKIEKELSHGGMGKVFLARDKNENKLVAIKILPSSLALNESYVTNFAREIRILQKLSHPGIANILSVGRETSGNGSDVYFYAMDYIEGKPLSELIKSKKLTISEAARIALRVALALDYIHKHKVVHRDIKPSNIMVRENGGIVLIDFGIARDTGRKTKKNRKTQVVDEISHYVGTPPYMSPEQLTSKRFIDHRTDLYSLGVTIYEMLTGARPYKGTGQGVYKLIMSWYPPPPSSIKPEIPKQLDIITMKALEKAKSRRYQSGAELAEDLHRFLHNKPILSQPIGSFARMWRKFRNCFRWI